MKPVHRVSRGEQSGPDERGNALVELALIMPLLALVLLVVVDLGMAVREHQVLQNAVREAARFSALPGNKVSALNPNATLAAIQQRVIQYCQQEKVTINTGEISINQSYPILIGVLTIEASQVTVVHMHPLLIPGAPFLAAGPLTLSASSVFRNMY